MTQRAPLLLAVAFTSVVAVDARADDGKRACVAASTEGQTLRKDDKLLAARDKLRVCANDPCPTVVKSHCTRWLSELERDIPTLIIRAKDSSGADILDADATLDGRPIKLGRPETVDPGEHLAAVLRAGARAESRFLLIDGEKARVVTVELPAALARGAEPAPSAAAPEPRSGGVPLGAWVLGGAGVAALGASAYFAIQASDDLSTLRATCAPGCTDSQTSTGRSHALLTDVSLGVGVAALGGAVVWALLGRSSADVRVSARPWLDLRPVAGGGIGAVGLRF